MATLSLTIFKAKQLSDGRHKIRIAVRHHHETSYIVTPYIIDNLSQFKDGRVIKRHDADIINVQLRSLLNKYQKVVDELYNVDDMSAKELKNSILSFKDKNENVTIGGICGNYVRELKEDGRTGYAELIERCGKYFMEFSRGDLQARAITPSTISNFERFLRNKKKLNQTTVGMYLTRFRVIVNLGQKRYFVKQDIHPFQNANIPQSLNRELDITVDQFQCLKRYTPKTRIEYIAKDLWLISFYLGGINLIDLLKTDFSDTRHIEYVRTKTKNTKRGDKRIELSIPKEAETLIRKYLSDDGKLDLGYNFTYRNFNRYVARAINKIGTELGIKRLCFYSARKSFVQYGFELGIPLEVLEYTIGQSMKQNRPIYNYIRIMRKHADDAVRKIINYTDNHEDNLS